MAGDNPNYTDGSGKSIPLNSAANVALAASDLDRRVAALEDRETAPGADTARMARLEAVLGNYFHNELAEYDAALAAK